MRKEIEGLKNCPHTATMPMQPRLVGGKQFAIQANFPAIKLLEPTQQPKQGRLASAGWPDQRKTMGEFDPELGNVQNQLSFVGFLQPLNF
jgi:hypothetical protein